MTRMRKMHRKKAFLMAFNHGVPSLTLSRALTNPTTDNRMPETTAETLCAATRPS